jgi:uncharacterized protein YggE
MKPLPRAAGLVAALMLATIPLTAGAQTVVMPDTQSSLSLSARGETQVQPDEASVSIGVQTKAATAAEAMSQNALAMHGVMAALKEKGLPDQAIQTAGVNLNPQYDYQPNQPPHLDGYLASNSVTVTVDNLAKLGPVIDAVTQGGANQINGVSFGLKDRRAAEDVARLAAVKDLRAKADLYAEATGYHLGRLIRLSEGGANTVVPVRVTAMAAPRLQGVPVTQVSPGELTVRIDINGSYELVK